MARAPFKLKSSPVKGRLGDFFTGLFENLKRNRRDIAGEHKGEKQKDIATSKYYEPKKTKSTKVETKKVEAKKVVTPKKPKIDWTKAPKVGTTARTNWYKKHNLELDDTTPGNKPQKDQGQSAIGGQYFKGDEDPNAPSYVPEGATYRYAEPPFPKKSPYKKGISKNYTRKPKGSRGYKMKRK